MGFRSGQDKDYMSRRFFQGFKQCIKSLCSKHMYFVNNINPKPAARRNELHPLPQVADLVNRTAITIMDNVIFVPRKFLSTLSLRRATVDEVLTNEEQTISIHALLAESDPPFVT